MKILATAFALACQFFSAIPIKRTLAMNTKTITGMFAMLPVVGLIVGAVYAMLYYSLHTWTNVSAIFTAVVLVIGGIVITGGLHMDGWLDMSDAFFSYGDKAKRQEVLDDPRTGAFGVISFVSLFALKAVTIYEVISQQAPLIVLLFIPVCARLAVLLFFVLTKPSKEKGLGAYFKKNTSARTIVSALICYTIAVCVIAISMKVYVLLFFIAVIALAVILYRQFSVKNFGGLSGDLMGALCEGMEVLLWIVLLLSI